MVECNNANGYFRCEVQEDKTPCHFIRIEPDDRNGLKLEGDFCKKCWNKLNKEVYEFFNTVCDKYNNAAKLLNP